MSYGRRLNFKGPRWNIVGNVLPRNDLHFNYWTFAQILRPGLTTSQHLCLPRSTKFISNVSFYTCVIAKLCDWQKKRNCFTLVTFIIYFKGFKDVAFSYKMWKGSKSFRLWKTFSFKFKFRRCTRETDINPQSVDSGTNGPRENGASDAPDAAEWCAGPSEGVDILWRPFIIVDYECVKVSEAM